MTDPGLEALDDAGAAGPVPVVPGAATTPRRGPGRPPGSGKKSGAQRRREAKERESGGQGAARGEAPPPPPPPPPAAKAAKDVDDAGLRMAREVVEDPNLLAWIEGLYRTPFELWAAAVKVPEVVPGEAKIQRTAKLIKKAMELFGVREWMKWLPLVFLLVAVGEDVAHGIGAMHAAKKRRESERGPAPTPAPQPRAARTVGPPPTMDAEVLPPDSSSGPLPPGDPA